MTYRLQQIFIISSYFFYFVILYNKYVTHESLSKGRDLYISRNIKRVKLLLNLHTFLYLHDDIVMK